MVNSEVEVPRNVTSLLPHMIEAKHYKSGLFLLSIFLRLSYFWLSYFNHKKTHFANLQVAWGRLLLFPYQSFIFSHEFPFHIIVIGLIYNVMTVVWVFRLWLRSTLRGKPFISAGRYSKDGGNYALVYVFMCSH